MDEQGNPFVGRTTTELLSGLGRPSEFGSVGGLQVRRDVIDAGISAELARRNIFGGAPSFGPAGSSIIGTRFLPGGITIPGIGDQLGGLPGLLGIDCIWPSKLDPVTGKCKLFVGDQEGSDMGGDLVPTGAGQGLTPMATSRTHLKCLPGMVLNKRNICVDKRNISNKERKYPRGRRPLLTGGDMRCIAVASRASKKLQSTTKRLMDMGMMPKKTQPRRRQKKPQVVQGGTLTVIDTE